MAKSIHDIAQLAGVSVTTVRLVINGQHKKYRIGEKTRLKVQAIIDKHGYYINQTARSLKLQKTHTIGLLVPRLTNPFFSTLAQELERLCREHKFQLITVCSNDDEQVEQEVTDNLLARGVDALLVTSVSKEQQHKLATSKRRCPTLFIDRDFRVENIPLVMTDNYHGGRLLGQALASTTLSSNIFFLGGNANLPTIQDRLAGFKDGLQESGITLPENQILWAQKGWREDSYELMAKLIQSTTLTYQTLVTDSIPVLEGTLQCLKDKLGVIPAGLKIGTFDDHTLLEVLVNPVISIRQDAHTLADKAFHCLEAMLNGTQKTPVRHVIPPQLIIRNCRREIVTEPLLDKLHQL
ncbi:substrate-binding domain-containing protein [Sansalvadorimonas sp. 2012CJ34-2]|uniref:Substrate-binding domain-containing protein n=1 Tax=Parendozoicomonas callyspongiae TaxID=2942213 RepID=A0ABT0PJZ9_9GAMM|nr:substrate-binding domain-containing protein [Sansalvadorimonas sp. 2012CJ34-2]MCL6271715.1 substrate-binding domain-containing protein [Sansalvadorimonas sp. 2012CJ34-2]